jgi:hypothetical protein
MPTRERQSWPVSRESGAPRSFAISHRHLGASSRYAMWSRALGNDIQLGVNEGNGNLVLRVPLGA